jgi:hypothetical protein
MGVKLGLSDSENTDRSRLRTGCSEGRWREVHNEEVHNLCSSPNIIRMNNSRRMRLAGHVARIGVIINQNKILIRHPEGKSHLDDQDVDRIILKCLYKKCDWGGGDVD